MSAAHTPGSIRYDFQPGYCGELVASNGTTIATFTDEPIKANARRIVACWNACEGISTEALELDGNLANGWRLASYAMRDAIAQRDELLAALKNVTVHLIAAHSLLKSGGKKAAASNKIFDQMLADYERSFEIGRAAWEKATGGAA